MISSLSSLLFLCFCEREFVTGNWIQIVCWLIEQVVALVIFNVPIATTYFCNVAISLWNSNWTNERSDRFSHRWTGSAICYFICRWLLFPFGGHLCGIYCLHPKNCRNDFLVDSPILASAELICPEKVTVLGCCLVSDCYIESMFQRNSI